MIEINKYQVDLNVTNMKYVISDLKKILEKKEIKDESIECKLNSIIYYSERAFGFMTGEKEIQGLYRNEFCEKCDNTLESNKFFIKNGEIK